MVKVNIITLATPSPTPIKTSLAGTGEIESVGAQMETFYTKMASISQKVKQGTLGWAGHFSLMRSSILNYLNTK